MLCDVYFSTQLPTKNVFFCLFFIIKQNSEKATNVKYLMIMNGLHPVVYVLISMLWHWLLSLTGVWIMVTENMFFFYFAFAIYAMDRF